jgi:RNA recognition motif-containing protein
MVNDINTGKPRGYAFIEYESEADMHGKLAFKLFIHS